MTITVQSVSTTAFSSTATLTLTKPSGTVDGDLLIATMFSNDRNVNSVPSGWTLIKNETIGGVDNHNAYYKVAASEGASWAWGLSTAEVFGGSVLRIDGQAGTFLDVNNSAEISNDDTPSFPNTITPTLAETMLVMCIASTNIGGVASPSSGYAIVTDNPTWTEQVDISTSLDNLLVATAIRPETTATGNSSVNLPTSASVDSSCIIFNLLQEVNVTTALDTAGQVVLSGNTVTFELGASIALDTAGVANLANLSPTISVEVKAEWANESRSSNTWSNQNKS